MPRSSSTCLVSGGVALWNVNRLSRDATGEIEHGLTKASQEYLQNYIETTALRADLVLDRVHSEVTALALSMQALIDHPEAREAIGKALAADPYFFQPLVYDASGKWTQNAKGSPSVMSVWGYLLAPDHQPLPDVLRDVEDSAIFNVFATSLMASGAKKLQVYYVGPKSRPIMRTTPYSDQAQTFDKLYPGHNDANFWDFFFPGVYEDWQSWLKRPEVAAGRQRDHHDGALCRRHHRQADRQLLSSRYGRKTARTSPAWPPPT